MRIGPDVAPYWGAADGSEPATALAIDAIVARSFMHRRLWLNDPDCLMLRAKETRLSVDERHALAWTIAASGGMLLISDDITLLSEESAKLFRRVAEIGAQVDAACAQEPVIAATLMQSSAVRILSASTTSGVLHLLLNMSDHEQEVRLADFLTGGARAATIAVTGETEAEGQIRLPAHSARIIRSD